MILLRGSKRLGVSIASQMKRFWHSRLSIPRVSNILSNDVVDNDVDELDDGVGDNISSSSSNINDLLRTSDGRNTVNGMLTRSSGKNEKISSKLSLFFASIKFLSSRVAQFMAVYSSIWLKRTERKWKFDTPNFFINFHSSTTFQSHPLLPSSFFKMTQCSDAFSFPSLFFDTYFFCVYAQPDSLSLSCYVFRDNALTRNFFLPFSHSSYAFSLTDHHVFKIRERGGERGHHGECWMPLVKWGWRARESGGLGHLPSCSLKALTQFFSCPSQPDGTGKEEGWGVGSAEQLHFLSPCLWVCVYIVLWANLHILLYATNSSKCWARDYTRKQTSRQNHITLSHSLCKTSVWWPEREREREKRKS